MRSDIVSEKQPVTCVAAIEISWIVNWPSDGTRSFQFSFGNFRFTYDAIHCFEHMSTGWLIRSTTTRPTFHLTSPPGQGKKKIQKNENKNIWNGCDAKLFQPQKSILKGTLRCINVKKMYKMRTIRFHILRHPPPHSPSETMMICNTFQWLLRVRLGQNSNYVLFVVSTSSSSTFSSQFFLLKKFLRAHLIHA